MKGYTHFTKEERYKLYELKQKGKLQKDIAKELGRSQSSISRELFRNSEEKVGYLPDTACHKYLERRKVKLKKLDNEKLKEFVLDKLPLGWSPESIAGYLKTQQKELPIISHETIYTWIYSEENRKEKIYKYLTKRRKKRGLRKSRKVKGAATIKIPQRKSVHERPDMANEFGHWEGDLMSFKGNTQFILTLLEKTTRYNVSIRLESKKSEHVIGEISKVFDKLPPEAKKSITFDNGLEFYNHSDLKEKHKIETYFCDPYKSWQKGAIENTNGRLRRDLPRSTEVKEMLEQDFQDTIRMNNKIPRKCLDFNDPETLFYNHLEEIALHA